MKDLFKSYIKLENELYGIKPINSNKRKKHKKKK